VHFRLRPPRRDELGEEPLDGFAELVAGLLRTVTTPRSARDRDRPQLEDLALDVEHRARPCRVLYFTRKPIS
jgi:hypothetical protein